MISPGALVTCRQTGTVLYVLKAPAPGGRWYLASKRVDQRGRAEFTGRVACAGDLTVIREARTFEPGETVEHDGLCHEVSADLGDEVEIVAGDLSKATVSKADLVLAQL